MNNHICNTKGPPAMLLFSSTEEKDYTYYHVNTCSGCGKFGQVINKETYDKLTEERYLKIDSDNNDKRILEAISGERYEEIKEIFKTLDRISETAQDLKAAIYERAYDKTLADIKEYDSVQDYVREMHDLTSSMLDKLQFELLWIE